MVAVIASCAYTFLVVQSRPDMSCALQQGGEEQQGVVRAVQLECRCMQHECSRQAEAIQLLETAADKRRMQERQQEHDFWDIAREALGKFWTAAQSLHWTDSPPLVSLKCLSLCDSCVSAFPAEKPGRCVIACKSDVDFATDVEHCMA